MQYETIQKLVRASGVSTGELILVHFWGDDADKETANRLMAAVAALGASPVLLQQSRQINRVIFSAAGEDSFNERYFRWLEGFDAVLDVFAYQPVVPGAQLEEGAMARYRSYMARLFNKLMACKRFTQIRLPTEANAAESGLEAGDFKRRMEQAYDIDYDALQAACRRELAHWAGAEQAVIRTGEGCVLRLELTGRTWHMDAGDGDLPCGEVYIAPVEDKTNGSVFFETFFLEGKRYENVTLEVAEGEVCGSSHGEIAAHFAGLPRAERVVCELGLGLNPHVTELCGYTVMDEKMAGTFHIAVGANHMFGGGNEAEDHTDFVGRGVVERME